MTDMTESALRASAQDDGAALDSSPSAQNDSGQAQHDTAVILNAVKDLATKSRRVDNASLARLEMTKG